MIGYIYLHKYTVDSLKIDGKQQSAYVEFSDEGYLLKKNLDKRVYFNNKSYKAQRLQNVF
jgi:hypothetical protein